MLIKGTKVIVKEPDAKYFSGEYLIKDGPYKYGACQNAYTIEKESGYGCCIGVPERCLEIIDYCYVDFI